MAASATPAATPSPGLEIRAAGDVAFESANPIMAKGVLDVYAPVAAGPWPVAVMFHGAGGSKDSLYGYATQVAALGFVVFVPTWGEVKSESSVELVSREGLVASNAQNACAVAFAASHAAAYGGDPTTFVIFGHSAGAMAGAGLALSGGVPSQGCIGGTVMPAVDALVTWEGDWLNASGMGWDELFASDPTVAYSASIWSALPKARGLRVIVLVGEDTDTTTLSLSVADLAVRDPTGALRDQLEKNGALADGQISLPESQQLLFSLLKAQGNPVMLDTMPGTTHSVMGDEGEAVFLAAFRKAVARG